MSNEGWPSAEASAPQLPKFEVKYPAQPDTEEPEAFRMRRNAEIQSWLSAKETAAIAVEHERDWRGKVTATCFPNPIKGTQRYDLGGLKLKLVYGFTYTLGDKNKLNEAGQKVTIEAQVAAVENAIRDKHGEAGNVLVERLIKWKPELSGSEYEKLNPDNPIELDVRNMIDEILTIKASSPQLTPEEPKA